MSICMVTGNEGYIGSHLEARLKTLGHKVIPWDIKSGSDIRRLAAEFQTWGKHIKIEYLFHLAAKPRVEYSILKPSDALSHNVHGTSSVLEFAHKTGVKRVIFSSSSAVYGDGRGPLNPYGLHKLMSEMECKHYSQQFNLPTVCLRYFNVYSEDQRVDGPYSTVIANWMERIRNGKDLIINGDGTIGRDYVHVNDVVEANIVAMECDLPENHHLTTDVGTAKVYTLNDIKEIILEVIPDSRFRNDPPRMGDPKMTKATLSPLVSFPWSAKIPFDKGCRECFSRLK